MALAVRAQELRHYVDIQRRRRARGAQGGWTQTWVSAANRFAKIRQLTGDEQIAARAAGSTSTHEITMRPYSRLTPANRIVFDSRNFEILEVRDLDERGILQVIRAAEVE